MTDDQERPAFTAGDAQGRTGDDAADDTRHAVGGDAAVYLEDLLAGAAPAALESEEATGPTVRIEMVGPHLRVTGDVALGRFRRLSDLLNNHEGLVGLRDAVVLYRDGTPTRVVTPALWVNLTEVTLVGQLENAARQPAPPEVRIVKEPHPMVFVTPGHTLTGDIYLTVSAELSSFIESDDPHFLPMTDVRTRSLADRKVMNRYMFALLNRRHIVATTRMLPEMALQGRTL
jgi:hypothetical protein